MLDQEARGFLKAKPSRGKHIQLLRPNKGASAIGVGLVLVKKGRDITREITWLVGKPSQVWPYDCLNNGLDSIRGHRLRAASNRQWRSECRRCDSS